MRREEQEIKIARKIRCKKNERKGGRGRGRWGRNTHEKKGKEEVKQKNTK